MATLPDNLPVYALAEVNVPAETDYLVFQGGAVDGDVGLLNIGTFLDTFLREYMNGSTIDSSTITLYESLGWEYEETQA